MRKRLSQDQVNKAILNNNIYVTDLDVNFAVIGIPMPPKCNLDISNAFQFKLYMVKTRLRELYDALREYYGDMPK
jgi:hypothetical protein